MDVDRQMLITAERDGYFGLRAKPALGSFLVQGPVLLTVQRRGRVERSSMGSRWVIIDSQATQMICR